MQGGICRSLESAQGWHLEAGCTLVEERHHQREHLKLLHRREPVKQLPAALLPNLVKHDPVFTTAYIREGILYPKCSTNGPLIHSELHALLLRKCNPTRLFAVLTSMRPVGGTRRTGQPVPRGAACAAPARGSSRGPGRSQSFISDTVTSTERPSGA